MGMIGISPTQNFAVLVVPWHLETEFLRGRVDRRAKDQWLHPHTLAAMGARLGIGLGIGAPALVVPGTASASASHKFIVRRPVSECMKSSPK